MNQIRRETLIDFYNRMGKIIETDFDLILFIQCFEALQKSEGHGFSFHYDDFNKALLRYQSSKTINPKHRPDDEKLFFKGVMEV